MDIITSHNSLDFDGLASIIAAGKLYPAAVKVLSGTLSKNVKQFMGLYKDSLMIKMASDININDIKRVILVDTRNLNRLGNLKGLANRYCEYHIYDHHPICADDITGTVDEYHQVGAATTILVEKMVENQINLTPFEATILALGIYEDTGSLLFSGTTSRDALAVAYLLDQGANLEVVNNFVERPFSSDQRRILQSLLGTIRHYEFNGADVAVATCSEKEFTAGLDLVVHRLAEVEVCDAIFAVAIMQGKAYIVARSRNASILVNEVLAALGGRGHDKAASAVVKSTDLNKIVEEILDGIKKTARSGISAKDIMSSPVKTLAPEVTMEEAGKTMLRYGHTGMPVVEDDKMVGVISRRDVDKARIHNLGHAPVKGFMTREVVSVPPNAPLSDIQKIVVERDIGRLPVIENDRLIGIVSRTDILRTLHGDEYPEDHAVLHTGSGQDPISNCSSILGKLPWRIREILNIAGTIGDRLGYNVYCVGGFVRDFLLGVPNFDVDLVIEGDGPEFAEELAKDLGGRARIHDRFKTAVVVLPDESKIDVATARTEYYEFPAALPLVEKSSIREDMYRRDFTINTLAICLNERRYGELIDSFGGQRDLKDGIIRILYNLSFIEDPTRILRAIRFEQRFKFKIDADTLRLAEDAIQRRLLGQLSYKRIQQELILILNEWDPVPALKRMDQIGVWQYVLPEIQLNENLRFTLRRIPQVLGWLAEKQLDIGIRSWVVYMQVLCSGITETDLQKILDRYPFDRGAVSALIKAGEIPKLATDFQALHDPRMSDVDRIICGLCMENIVYFLLCLEEEWAWEFAARYLETRSDARLAIDGNDLKRLGLKPGPAFNEILGQLRIARLDGDVNTVEEELELVQLWMEEGRFNV